MSFSLCDLDIGWCVVTYLFLGLSFALFLLTIYQFVRIAKLSLYLSTSYKLVFISQIFETLLMTLHFFLFSLSDLGNITFLLQEYFISIQYSCSFYYFISQLSEAFKILRVFPKIKLPLIVINISGIFGFGIFVTIKRILGDPLYNCNNLLWVYLHAFNFGLSLIFIGIGLKANRTLRDLMNTKGLVVSDKRLKQFWVLILFMLIGSVVNIGESIWYIDMSNSSCYDSYVGDMNGNIVIFCFIRFISHYLYIIICLIVFRYERISAQSIVVSESDRGENMQSYIGRVMIEKEVSFDAGPKGY